MSAKDKSFAFDFTGTYTEVENLKKIAYKMDKAPNEETNRGCLVTFEETGDGKTKVVVEFDAENENPIEMQKNGWQSILENFKKLVERVD
jgi:uncharacterized protein YndB with AHSA1/START domain